LLLDAIKAALKMTTTTIKKIRAVKPPYPFEAYSHIISQLSKEEGVSLNTLVLAFVAKGLRRKAA
jgi:hypothetical protein